MHAYLILGCQRKASAWSVCLYKSARLVSVHRNGGLSRFLIAISTQSTHQPQIEASGERWRRRTPARGKEKVLSKRPPRGRALSSVNTGLEVFDCPSCFEPLGPPIFQCAVGHLVCSACIVKLKDTKCLLCARPCSERCFGMERVVDSILVPCPYAKHGCPQLVIYHKTQRHAKACVHARCFCPEPGCGFAGPTVALLDHLTAAGGGGHNLPSKLFSFYEPFDLRARPGLHVLYSKDEAHLFLLNVAPSPSLGHAVSLVAVQPDGAVESGGAGRAAAYSGFGCSVIWSCFPGHHQIATLDRVRCSSLANGLPAVFFCVVPMVPEEGGDGATLRFTIDTELWFDDVEEMEEDDDDEDEEWRAVVVRVRCNDVSGLW